MSKILHDWAILLGQNNAVSCSEKGNTFNICSTWINLKFN